MHALLADLSAPSKQAFFTAFQKPVFELIAQNCEFYFLYFLYSVSPGDYPVRQNIG
jgi:hypothetical protein